MTSTAGAEPRDDVPEADWAEQQITAEPDADDSPTVPMRPAGGSEADPADVADQGVEVVLDDED